MNTTVNFTSGQRVYIMGTLKPKPIRLNDDKMVTRFVVKAYQLFTLENKSASVHSTTCDQNQVELLGNIISDVTVRDGHCTFAVATHFKIQ